MALFAIHEISQALSPSILEFNQYFDKFNIILQLWIHNLYILFILFEQSPEISKCLLYTLS